ncbi:hypothetical protein JOE61_004074 [Nocardioides salarius]|uniref:Protein kinase domain-containing protein n=1 Tax=Nocardioides salarius TaxID=374513 RepID=A0ABS2MGE7_9ACTN|nr:protein kinase family protein [Nocardioides salarius]MBM7510260.1 hypothetical protein [Nocardioides salarius]
MAGNPHEYMLADLRADYAAESVPPRITRLYEDDPEWGHMFGVLHKQLNQHFDDINRRIGNHYWADNSRDLIRLTEQIEQDLHTLRRGGIEVEFDPVYENALEACRPWLSPSGGSPVPEDFAKIEVERFKPVLTRSTTAVKLTKQSEPALLQMVGTGSYATVYSYVDPDYEIKFALKRAKKDIGERDLIRFKAEFDYMKRLSHPNLVEVYKYDDDRSEYRMEYCDETLRDFIRKRNSTLESAVRKNIALQFLSAISYLHREGILHRDISLQNILLRVYGSGEVQVKVSDFGLAKDQSQAFTLTNTEMRGTIRDPMLTSFKHYGVANELYSIAWVLSYVVTGRESLMPVGTPLGDIIQRCAHHSVGDRYATVDLLIAAIAAI